MWLCSDCLLHLQRLNVGSLLLLVLIDVVFAWGSMSVIGAGR
jgi:hypothetical protein